MKRRWPGDVTAAILVLNAGSSSLKFTEFVVGEGDALDLKLSGNLEELYGRARFRATDTSGAAVGEHTGAKTSRRNTRAPSNFCSSGCSRMRATHSSSRSGT